MSAGKDHGEFEQVARATQGDVAMVTHTLIKDGALRQQYQKAIAELMAELRREATSGKISWRAAVERANGGRNFVMDSIRGRTSPVGRASAKQLKLEGRTLNELIAKYTLQKHGPAGNFNKLSAAQKDVVYAEIVSAAGRGNPAVNKSLLRMSRAGRALLVLSVAVSVYNITTSDNPGAAAVKEGAVTGAGILGGAGGGALAGLVCGPGAPVCVGIGMFVGGAMAAVGVDMLW